MGGLQRWALPLALCIILGLCAGCAAPAAAEIVDIGMEETASAPGASRGSPGSPGDPGSGTRGEAPAASDGPAQNARQAAAYEQVGEVEKVVGNEVTLLLQKESGGAYEPTGETAAYLIPVGMQVGGGDYSSVSAGMLLGFSAEGDRMTSVTLLRR